MFITTLNKTFLSYWLGIVAAEYILKIVPPGTHEFDKFVSPESVQQMLKRADMRVLNTKGLMYNPVCNAWSWSEFDHINYACVAAKEPSSQDGQ